MTPQEKKQLQVMACKVRMGVIEASTRPKADIPAQQRDTLPLLAAGSEVLWVCGSGFAEGLAPDETTTQILQMEQET